MSMWKIKLGNFSSDEKGAATVDWVVLTAAVVGISLVGGYSLLTPIHNAASTFASEVQAYDP